VLLSFSPCQACEQCKTDHPGHCVDFNPINFEVRSDDYLVAREASSPSAEPTIYGKFFGQSSLASLSIVNARSVVNVAGLVESREELALYAPLGCGIQTGSGAIIQAAQARTEDRVTVLGLGGVGLSAVMGAKLQGCEVIIGVDRFESRLELARALGATHVINTAGMASLSELTEEVRKITHGLGTTITLDSSGFPPLIREGLNLTSFKGKLIQVGVAPVAATLDIPIFEFMVAGKQYMGIVQGDVQPQVYIPRLIRWVQEGKMPLDRVKMYPAAGFAEAIKDMQSGATVKPVIRW
jgi:Zn-dependent alcohol dehydrogenase